MQKSRLKTAALCSFFTDAGSNPGLGCVLVTQTAPTSNTYAQIVFEEKSIGEENGFRGHMEAYSLAGAEGRALQSAPIVQLMQVCLEPEWCHPFSPCTSRKQVKMFST